MPSIPANVIVNVTPNVIGAGGNGLDMNGLILTLYDIAIPIGAPQSFPDAASVAAFFGPSGEEAIMAAVYFGGFDGSNLKPGALLFSQYANSARAAWLAGGSLASMTLAQLQALGSGTLTITVNGAAVTSGTIALGSATSFSNAAAAIQTALAHFDAVGTGSISGTTLTITAVASGTFAVGQLISGSGVSSVRIALLGTGTGGTGTYTIEGGSQTVSSTTISAGPTTVIYDSQRHRFLITGGTPGIVSSVSFATGGLANGLKLNAVNGAVQSPGTAAMTPASAMDAVVANTQDFASFSTTWEPTLSDSTAFAAWNNGKTDRYLYAAWDTDNTAATVVNDPSTLGYAIATAGYSGTALLWSPAVVGTDPDTGPKLAAFVMGAVASLDFAQADGRATLAFRSLTGLTPGVTDAVTRATLIANGYNFYGSFATANDQFTFFDPGNVSGPFLWIDSYVDQIWLNNGFQLALMNLLTNSRSIPYNDVGYAMIETAMLDQITAALNFGAIRAGVTLSALQATEVNTAAGLNVSSTIETRGWYVQVKDATPDIRAARASPPVNFWYTDGQSVQQINLASVEIA